MHPDIFLAPAWTRGVEDMASGSIHTHKLDQWALIYDQPVVLMQRQAGVAIEGIVRQQAAADIERLAVDTHGFTQFGMAAAKVLGFDLCPRLKGLRRH